MSVVIDYPAVIARFDAILSRGLSEGLGNRHQQMCVEAAICAALNEPHGDNPTCVELAVRTFKIALNDCDWSSPIARAKGLRDVGIGQLGSKGVVDGQVFAKRVADRTIRELIPTLIRECCADNEEAMKVARTCEHNGTVKSILPLFDILGPTHYFVARAVNSAADALVHSVHASQFESSLRYAVWAAQLAEHTNTIRNNSYLLLSASFALDTLKELKSPGCEWLDK